MIESDPYSPIPDSFVRRHIGPSVGEIETMLAAVGYQSIDELVDTVVPPAIRERARLALPEPRDEQHVLQALAELSRSNSVRTSMIGKGYYGTITPPVLRRNVLENPAWYTAYTPYQPEISQGRLEVLLTFQTMVCDLTGMELANASMLDESTAAAEAMTLALRANPDAGETFVVDADTHPQTLAVLITRAEPLGISVVVSDELQQLPEGTFGVLASYPGSSGELRELAPVAAAAHRIGALLVVVSDLLACCVLTPPGDSGADVVVGSTQRFGVPMGFGGPSAGFLAIREKHRRILPGRLVGVSVDAAGRTAHRLALQTREQHIRREKATSNICTAQVLLAVMAALYASWHGPQGLRAIATRVHDLTRLLSFHLKEAGVEVCVERYFDTVTVRVPGRAHSVQAMARENGVDIFLLDADHLVMSCDETTEHSTINALLAAFEIEPLAQPAPTSLPRLIDGSFERHSTYLDHPNFTTLHSETDMVRHLRRLADLDLALDRTMIPLGSCTMKLNAAAEMEPISWPEFANLHPFAPFEDTAGSLAIIDDLERWLAEITGYDAVSLQPNAGSQGEFAGLLAIRAWHRSNGDDDRTVCLIPASAHGTNAASAAMAGMLVVVVACDANGNVDVRDLHEKIDHHRNQLAALMITYPSTHGVFEEAIGDICEAIHAAGGQVYLDGANLNALVGVAKPGQFGADVSHLNLHKTFCIPHGGGGPGVGPVAVRAHLAPFLPTHPVVPGAGPDREEGDGIGPVVGPISAAPYGSAGILPIPWAYISLMGPEGLARATALAILNANYVAHRLRDAYPILYTGRDGLVAHECILDIRPLTKETGVTVDDVAKRLMDYGFHAPTMSFPVAGTLMVETTESESLRELDRFCDAMLAIRREITLVGEGRWPADDNPLCNAPHPAQDVATDHWTHPYSRDIAAYPAGNHRSKYWPPVSRIDGAFGDRNVVCSCPPVEAFAD
ncbi:MAG: aminomethyl-transferring glycine dehydrogenase [Actinobacteria bacterium]|uniref:glycine dehydrogenase (aminomethyl-transferring) n=1 Tax=freshwater metagenome TaxID=449393 RepID=A0A6J5YFC4_9ZZZZ|nr:aminomethyl-transferring glycine dehydrogenase [Actinomycetota bacterium]